MGEIDDDRPDPEADHGPLLTKDQSDEVYNLSKSYLQGHFAVKVRHVNFYADDWIAGTVGMPAEQIGLFISICALIYANNGPIPDDEKKILMVAGMHWRSYRKAKLALIDAGKMTSENGQIDVKKCSEELQRSFKKLSRMVENGRKGGRPPKEINELEKPNGFEKNNRPCIHTNNESYKRKEEKEAIASQKKIRIPKPDISAWLPNQAHHDLALDLGHDGGWVADQEQRYRDWLPNAGRPHRDFDAGFRNWLRKAGEGATSTKGSNGHAELTPANKRFLASREATFRAAIDREQRRFAAEAGDGEANRC